MGELSEEEQQYQLQLARASGFTLEDLAANREGRLSERQLAEANSGCSPFRGSKPAKDWQVWFIEGVPIRADVHRTTADGRLILEQGAFVFYKFEDDSKIPVSKGAYAALREGQPHRVYHGAKMTELSIEVLPMSWNPAESKIKGTVERKEG